MAFNPAAQKGEAVWVKEGENEKARIRFRDPRLIHIPSRGGCGSLMQIGFPPEPNLRARTREVAVKLYFDF